MKKTIRIFVAGAKELKTERNALKAVAQDLNTRYVENAVDASIVMKSYEHFKDRQKEYNDYITEYADLVIFVLDGKIGEFTREEFLKATEAYKKKEIPEIMVFLKNFDKETENIKEIKNLMRDSMGEHFFYITYNNDEDLQSKAKERINSFVSPTEHSRDTKRWRLATFLVALAALMLIGLLALFTIGNPRQEQLKEGQTKFDTAQRMLLFMGGGSVYKYIEDKGGVKVDSIDEYPNSIYMPTATGNLWSMIAEEYYQNRLGENQKFFPLFLAASKIDTFEVNKKSPLNGKFYDNMIVCELNLGNDTTVVYFGKNGGPTNYTEKTLGDGRKVRCLNASQLCEAIANARAKDILYTTSTNSGTFKSFCSILRTKMDSDSISTIFKTGRREFHEKYLLVEPNYMVLGSVFYYPRIMKSLSAGTPYSEPIPHDEKSMYFVLDAKRDFYQKDMCLYFVAYHNTMGKYEIPKTIRDFLEEHLNLEVTGPQWKKIINNDGVFSRDDAELKDVFYNDYIIRFNATLKKKD